MGFPSPAIDYIEQRLTVTSLCHFDANCRAIETNAGYVIVDLSLRPKQGDHVLTSFCGSTQFAIVRGRALITSDGEAVEGEALNDVEIRGVVTCLINRANSFEDDSIPVI